MIFADAEMIRASAKMIRAGAEMTFADAEMILAGAEMIRASAKMTFADAEMTFADAKMILAGAEMTFAGAKMIRASAEMTFADAEMALASHKAPKLAKNAVLLFAEALKKENGGLLRAAVTLRQSEVSIRFPRTGNCVAGDLISSIFEILTFMKALKIGLIREGKTPPDKRVPFTPTQVEEIHQRFPHVKIVCEESPIRCFKDDEYKQAGADVKAEVSDCDILMGIKEVPVDRLIANKTYLFFSHTIKKQVYNRKLLQEVLKKKIRLIDYEALKDSQGNRMVAFGRYAGIVGAYNGLWAYGKRFRLFSLRRAFECFDVNDLKLELRRVKLPAIKIILTGAGRVAKGAMETLDTAGIRKVSPQDFLLRTFDEPVYVQLSSADYHVRKEGGAFNREEFHSHPEKYDSTFLNYASVTDLLLAGAFWNPKAPVLFTTQDMLSTSFKIKVIADITCDIEGSVPSTKRASTIIDPIYDYDAATDSVQLPLSNDKYVTVMAIDNLPCELPRSASEEFGRDLIDRILKPLLIEDTDGVVARGTIAVDGMLTPAFEYLRDYVNG